MAKPYPIPLRVESKCMAQGILTRLVTQPSNGNRGPHVSAWEEALGRGNPEEMHVTQPSKVLWCLSDGQARRTQQKSSQCSHHIAYVSPKTSTCS